jgi:transcriptional regulator with XRE-family HTH domain
MKPKSPYGDAHITLKRLWDEPIGPTGMSQEEFGELYGIGSQAMVSQYLLGTRPLNYDAAAKFAKGYGCSIEDICPEMARTLAKDIFPVLRRRLRRTRAAMLALALTGAALVSDDARAIEHNLFYIHALNTHCMRFLRWLLRLRQALKFSILEATPA